MVGDPEPTVYESGWHFGLPYPIEQQVRVPVTTQTIDLINAFWYEGQNNPNDDRLNPLEDGYLLTGDGGIVHARFQIDYAVTDPIQFIRQIKGTRAGRAANAAAARTLMRSVAEQGIARAVAQTPADAVVAGNANTGSARLYMQQRLDAMNSGLTVQSVSIQSDATLPGPVQDDYQAVTRAENTRQQKIQTAQNERERILVSAGGEAAMPGEDGQPGPLLQVIDQYQIAVRAGENDKAAQLQQRLARAMQASPPRLATADDQRVRIGGEAASVLSEARSYANQIEQTLRSEQNTFNELLSQYRQNPRILISRIWQDVREKVLTGNGIETIYSMTGKPYIVVNRDPEVQRQREQAAIEAQGQQSNQDAQ
jgi:regulator of protease activity HflC (stomatin/prohibitin superfamily)